MRKSPIGFLILLSSAAGADTLTLEDAVRTARSRHPAVTQERAALEAARARLEQARSAFLPALTGGLAYVPQTANFVAAPAFQRAITRQSGTASVDVNGAPVDVTCSNPTAGGPCFPNSNRVAASYAPFNYWTASLGVNWTLWDWGRTPYNVRASATQVDAQKLTVESSLLQVTLDVKLAYYNVLASQAAVQVAEDAVGTQRRHADQARAFYQVGTRTKIDVASAESDVAASELTLARAHGALDAAQAALAAALGDERWRAFTLVTPGEYDQAAPTALENAIDEALRARPEPRALTLLGRSYHSLAKSARGAFLPSLTLQLGPTWAGTDITTLTTNFSATLSLGFPLGGMNPLFVHGQMREFEAERAVAEAQAANARNGVRLETAQAHAFLVAAREAIVAAQKLLTAARERQQLAEGRYQAGVGSIIELSDAELAYVNAQFQSVQASLDLASARARLDHALGR
jgi:outer membrane protein